MGIALNLQIAFGKIAIFTILILPIHEHGRSFHLLRSSLISFFRDLKFLSYISFTCLVRVTPSYSSCCSTCNLIYFFRDLKFFSYRSFASIVRVTPRYFILFVTIVKGVVSLISFSSCLSFVQRKAIDLFELILYPANFPEGVYQVQEFSGGIFRVT